MSSPTLQPRPSQWVRQPICNLGRNRLAPSTLNMLPKFELAPILMYLVMLPNTLRPSMTPSCGQRIGAAMGYGAQHRDRVGADAPGRHGAFRLAVLDLRNDPGLSVRCCKPHSCNHRRLD